MNIWCDVCGKEKATVFCSADEAALCDVCDGRVHHANKLACKHLRFSLVNPTSKQSPLCDICQERRALLFCQEDRAILCRECDLPIHKANEHTKKHNRFLLTGVNLSASSSLYPIDSSSSSDASVTTAIDIDDEKKKKNTKKNRIIPSHSSSVIIDDDNNNHVISSENGSISTSSFSEYLMETIPGWRVEDLLDPSTATTTTTNVFCKTSDDEFCPFLDQDLESNNNVESFSSEDLGIWVPESALNSGFAVPRISFSHPCQNNNDNTRHTQIW
ncbi:hypothetical protein LWI28_024328 [Acer negundo]|uniref:B box-type domain-containing protein n=1 Tax=Acer negundo TaxID=4023 RepID=A0AAD5J1F2_ACENE|nr:hypothetical protein LWI28_024328 [Acer negundo]KAK4835739.1 hypothetical protein QYF36_013841 [Acer negundo]